MNEDDMGFAVPESKLSLLFTELAKQSSEYAKYCVGDNLDKMIKQFTSLDFSNNPYGFSIVEETEFDQYMDKDETYYFFLEEGIVDFINDFVDKQINDDLMHLSKMGLVEYRWSDEKNDFIFSLTDDARDMGFNSSGD
jgi:hypothetical protein